MEGEIARTGEAGGFGLKGVQPMLVPLPLTQLKCQICPFCSVQMLLFLSHTVRYKSHLVVCHSLASILFNHPFSYLAPGFKNMQFLYLSLFVYTLCVFFSLSPYADGYNVLI